jgi:UPF0755 protein
LLLLVALLVPAYELLLPAGPFPSRERRTVILEHGVSLRAIAGELQRAGILRSPIGFLVLARLMRLDRHVKAGQYAFRLGITVPALLRALDRGMYGLDLLTIPEGLTVREIAVLLAPRLGVPPATIDSLARSRLLLDSLGVSAPSLEGYLAPDSYEWLPGTPPEAALRAMVAHTRDRLQRATAGCDSLPLGFGENQLLTMASIVESEAMSAIERPRIARVYLNRLVLGMRLQADPTVGFALGRNPRSRLTLRELRVESPYNTYLHPGMPPGPICSPGEASIVAVVNASPDVKDLYFVARGDGRHLFATSFAQHSANIQAARALQGAFSGSRAAPDTVARPAPARHDSALSTAVKPVKRETLAVAHLPARRDTVAAAKRSPAKRDTVATAKHRTTRRDTVATAKRKPAPGDTVATAKRRPKRRPTTH